MREILFRGKRTDNGEWVYGWLGHLHCYNPQEKNISSIYFTEITEDFNTKSNIIVDYKTVGQYTGLKDSNGKRIFEGDIVTGLFDFELSINSVVTFKDGAFGVLAKQHETEHFHPFTSLCNVKYEVIGNIFENIELLEVAE